VPYSQPLHYLITTLNIYRQVRTTQTASRLLSLTVYPGSKMDDHSPRIASPSLGDEGAVELTPISIVKRHLHQRKLESFGFALGFLLTVMPVLIASWKDTGGSMLSATAAASFNPRAEARFCSSRLPLLVLATSPVTSSTHCNLLPLLHVSVASMYNV